MTLFDQQIELGSTSGASLNLLHMRPRGNPRAIVQINHGVAEHAARYQTFAHYLGQLGFATFVHDHRGHGATTAPDAPIGRFAKSAPGMGWAKPVEDVKCVNDYACKQYPGLPLIVFGHSMGGLIAMNFALTHPVRLSALAIWNTNFTSRFVSRLARSVLASERMMLGSDVPSRILPAMTFQTWGKSLKNAQTPFDWLSHNDASVRAYINDPLCGWDASVALWQDIFAMASRGRGRAELGRLPSNLPVHLVGGGQDPSTEGGKAVIRYAKQLRSIGLRDVTGRIYEGFRHETLHETASPGSRGAMEDFAAWATSAIKRSGATVANIGQQISATG